MAGLGHYNQLSYKGFKRAATSIYKCLIAKCYNRLRN